MTYLVNETFYTLQGEGTNAGRPAVFCRFTGCNLWTGREDHRAGAVCQFCDTDFVGTGGAGGGKFATAGELASHIASMWHGATDRQRFVVCTGGEPLLQLDADLIDALHTAGFEIAIETNGTIALPSGPARPIDWICVSPKAGTDLLVTSGDELKLIYPQAGAEPERYEGLAFDHFLLQPMDGPDRETNTALAVEHCLAHPRWRLSLQTHKYLGIR